VLESSGPESGHGDSGALAERMPKSQGIDLAIYGEYGP